MLAVVVSEGAGEEMSADGGFGWTVVVLSCQHKDSVYSFQRGESPRWGGPAAPHSRLNYAIKQAGAIVVWTFTHLRDDGHF